MGTAQITVYDLNLPATMGIPMFENIQPSVRSRLDSERYFVFQIDYLSGNRLVNTFSSRPFEAYVYIDRPRVDSYLKRHRKIREFIPQLKDKVSEVFGESTRIVLQITSDYDGGKARLYVGIRFHGGANEAFEKMRSLEKTWWYRNPLSDSGLMVLDVELP